MTNYLNKCKELNIFLLGYEGSRELTDEFYSHLQREEYKDSLGENARLVTKAPRDIKEMEEAIADADVFVLFYDYFLSLELFNPDSYVARGICVAEKDRQINPIKDIILVSTDGTPIEPHLEALELLFRSQGIYKESEGMLSWSSMVASIFYHLPSIIIDKYFCDGLANYILDLNYDVFQEENIYNLRNFRLKTEIEKQEYLAGVAKEYQENHLLLADYYNKELGLYFNKNRYLVMANADDNPPFINLISYFLAIIRVQEEIEEEILALQEEEDIPLALQSQKYAYPAIIEATKALSVGSYLNHRKETLCYKPLSPFTHTWAKTKDNRAVSKEDKQILINAHLGKELIKTMASGISIDDEGYISIDEINDFLINVEKRDDIENAFYRTKSAKRILRYADGEKDELDIPGIIFNHFIENTSAILRRGNVKGKLTKKGEKTYIPRELDSIEIEYVYTVCLLTDTEPKREIKGDFKTTQTIKFRKGK